jgi:hypothetical protein
MMRHGLALGTGILLFAAWMQRDAVAQPAPPPGFAVVELFTSQGCSSCPPADDLLAEVAAGARASGKPVYALSFHVDYWNRLGWKDPYSRAAFSRRQTNYVSSISGSDVFTPQVFVNGRGGFVGSDREKMRLAIDEALHKPSREQLTVRNDSVLRDTLFLSFAGTLAGSGYSLAFAVVERKVRTSVTRGENKGRTLTHANVVRVFDVVPLRNRTGRAAVALHALRPGPGFSLIAFVQQKGSRLVLAATGLAF